MRKLLLAISICLCLVAVSSAGPLQEAHKAVIARQSVAEDEGGPDYTETFETTSATACQGFDLYGSGSVSITCVDRSSGTYDEDYTVSENGMPSEGSTYSHLTHDSTESSDESIRIDFGEQLAATWLLVDFSFTTTLSGGYYNILSWRDDHAYDVIEYIRINNAGSGWFIRSDSGTDDTTELSTGTKYTLKVKYDFTGEAYELKINDTTIFDSDSWSPAHDATQFLWLMVYPGAAYSSTPTVVNFDNLQIYSSEPAGW
jgi:hypothetical protein